MSDVSHSIITPECRVNRGDEGAWDEAVARAKAIYDQIVEGWRNSELQPTLHLRLELERPFRPAQPGDGAEFRVCEHGNPLINHCNECAAVSSTRGD